MALAPTIQTFIQNFIQNDSAVAQRYRIRTSNRKFIGSTPVGRTRISFFLICLCHFTEKYTILNSYLFTQIWQIKGKQVYEYNITI